MSKMSEIKSMSGVNASVSEEFTSLEIQMVYSQLAKVSKELHDWMDKSGDVLKSQRNLQQLVVDAAKMVHSSAQEVKGYPVSVSERIEQSAKKCEESAKEAEKVYHSAQRLVTQSEAMFAKRIIYAAVCAAVATTTIQLVVFSLV